MTTKEKIDDYPLNSDYEEKLLLDELISISYSGEHLYISHNQSFTYVYEKTLYVNMCKNASHTTRANSENGFKQRLTWLKTEGGEISVC